MKQLIFLLLISSKIFTQNSDAIFLFSVIDTNGIDLPALQLNASAIAGNEVKTDKLLSIQYDANLEMYILNIPEKYSGNIIIIQIQRQTGNAVEIMNIYYKSSKQNDLTSGCHYCVCNDVVYKPGKYIFDMPMQAASWTLIPDIIKERNGLQITLKDITILQNWRDQQMK